VNEHNDNEIDNASHNDHFDNGDGMQGEGSVMRKRLRWAGAALVVLMLGSLVWQAVEAGRADPHSPADAEVEALAHPQKLESLASMNEVQLAQQGVSAVTAALGAPPVAGPAADELEVCGLGRVKADEAGRPRDMAPIHAAAQRLRAQVLPTLLDSQDDTTRAAGLLMVALGDGPAAGGIEGGAPRARDELASMAALKGTPQLYAWAMRACHQQRGEGMCRMLSSDQWARLEPANAMAWLQVAADAKLRRDEAAVAEAMHRVSLAGRSDARQGSLVSAVLAKLPPEADLLARVGLALDLAKLDARAELPLAAASQYCGVNETRDANRQQVCASVASVLTKRGGTLAEAALGASIGDRVGWSAERLAAAAEEHDAIAQLAAAGLSGEAWGCNGMALALSRIHESARQGELATLRTALKRSPEGAEVLARRYREAQALRVASAASAASATSP
jgi:hypothetical protein